MIKSNINKLAAKLVTEKEVKVPEKTETDIENESIIKEILKDGGFKNILYGPLAKRARRAVDLPNIDDVYIYEDYRFEIDEYTESKLDEFNNFRTEVYEKMKKYISNPE